MPVLADPGPVTRAAARAAAQRELSAPAYHRDDPSTLQRVVDGVERQLGAAASRITAATPGGALGLVLLAGLVVAVVVLIRVRLGRLEVGTLFGAPRERTADLTAAQLRAEADRLAAEGRWRDAVRASARAAFRGLEQRGLVTALPGRTAGTLAREAAERLPGAGADARLVASLVEEVLYGGRPADRDVHDRVRAADARLQGLREGSRVVPDDGLLVPR